MFDEKDDGDLDLESVTNYNRFHILKLYSPKLQIETMELKTMKIELADEIYTNVEKSLKFNDYVNNGEMFYMFELKET